MSYLNLLKLLLSLGPKITEVWPHLQKIGADELDALHEAQAIAALVQGSNPAPNMVAMTTAKINGEAVACELLEKQVLSHVQHMSAGFGLSIVDILRAAAGFLISHPEIIQAIEKLIGGLVPHPAPLPAPPAAV